MKKYSIFILCCLLLFAFSCKEGTDLLDPETSTDLTEEEVFSNAQNAMMFLNDIYGQLLPVIPQTGNKGMRWRGTNGMLEVTTDNGSTNQPSSGPYFTFNSGAWSPATATFSKHDWDMCWTAIRACYIFLKHIDHVPLDSEYNFTETI